MFRVERSRGVLFCSVVIQVLSTNIAETSVTINDVVFVIDCGKVKEVKTVIIVNLINISLVC